MNQDDIRIIKYHSLPIKNFNHWVFFQDLRPSRDAKGRKGRKNLIRYLESILGPISQRWQYQHPSDHIYILQLVEEKDLLFFLLKFKQVK